MEPHLTKLGPNEVLTRMYPYGPICNAKERTRKGTSLGRTQDILTIIHEMVFYEKFFTFPDSNFISGITLPK